MICIATGMELAIFGNATSGLLGIFGGNVILFGGFVFILGLVILLLLRMPTQMIIPLLAFLILLVAVIVPPLQTILWLVAGAMIAFFAYRMVRGY